LLYNLSIYLIKSVSINKLNIIYLIFNYFRDFEKELYIYYYFTNWDVSNIIKRNKDWYNNLFLRFHMKKRSISNYKSSNNQLGHYLAGLIESDGSIIIPKKKSNNSPTISIVFHLDDKPLADCLRKKLGYGSLEIISSKKAVKLYIRGKRSILDIMRLINGKFRTPKIEKFQMLVGYVNNNWKEFLKIPLIHLPLDDSPLCENSWLAGFSDGDAHLNINITWPKSIEKKYGQIRLTFEIVQSRLDEELFNKYKPIMNKLSLFFESKLEKHSVSKYDRSGKQDAWRARIVNKKGADVLVKYFNNFPMFSSKYLNYLDWRSVHIMLNVNKEHIGENKVNTYNKVNLIKNGINSKRSNFNWDHLNYLYNR
jgi:hypothetical protein